MNSVVLFLTSGLFSGKKKRDDDEYIEELLDDIDYYKEELAKLKGEFQEYKKNQQKVNRSRTVNENAQTIERFLDIKDSLEKAASTRERDPREMRKGLLQIMKQMDQTLRSLGVEIIDPVNQPFDPEYHEALKKVSLSTLPDETVTKVYTRGYVYKGKVLRPARVVISTGGVRRGRVPGKRRR